MPPRLRARFSKSIESARSKTNCLTADERTPRHCATLARDARVPGSVPFFEAEPPLVEETEFDIVDWRASSSPKPSISICHDRRRLHFGRCRPRHPLRFGPGVNFGTDSGSGCGLNANFALSPGSIPAAASAFSGTTIRHSWK